MPQSMFNVCSIAREEELACYHGVRVMLPQGPVKRFVKSQCLDVKCAFKWIKLAP